jgi:aromatic ring-opening dioxygenase LigB subunit
MISFACFSPHPPLLLPYIGSVDDRIKVKKTLQALEFLEKQFKEAEIDEIIISSPHADWGFNVPLYFLAPDFKGKTIPYLTGPEPPLFHFNKGKEIYSDTKYRIQDTKYKVALIASGDTSHCLRKGGPYGFYTEGPKFDKVLISYLKEKNIEKILDLGNVYPNAAECGLRSFSFILGILEASGIDWQPEILSYEGPLGVGYLVVNFRLEDSK